ncbi:MAG: T9SS type A sorting domain-containing protein [Taibaiella sp.]|nr:T9SS type A sorting domain-containing protein [Taibaiella sp.]
MANAAYGDSFNQSCQDAKTRLYRTTKTTTVADTAENNYDIQYLKFNITLSNTSTAVSGDVTTRATVTATSLPKYIFELNSALTIDSFKLNGILQTVTTSGTLTRTVTLTTALPSSTLFTAQVYYHGTSPAGTGFFTHGLNQSTLSSGTQIMYTCSDPDWASDWWPCKSSLQDKIDSVDMYVTVPSGTKAGSNGLLVSTTPISGGSQFHWRTHYPIDYYLISVAVAPYVDYTYYMHFTGSTDSMPVQNFFYDTATFMPLYKSNFDTTGLIIDYFSQLYGRYPYWKEKYGHCFSNLGGGMEHQTMTTIGVTQTPLIAHELTHQWFGDCVTYASWADIWLSEGFASYGEQLFVEHFQGINAAYNYRTARYNTVLSSPTGSVYVDDTTSVYRIFDGRLTYYKGAAVVHMLRFMAPSDSVFFSVLKTYQQTYAYGQATTTKLKNIVATLYSRNMDTFFNQWVYGQGYPTYAVQYNQIGNIVYLQITQTTSDTASVKVFATPLELQLRSATGDTAIKVYNNQPVQLYTIMWGKAINGLNVDPNNWILNKTGAIVRNNNLAANTIENTITSVYPNPATNEWHIANIAPQTLLVLIDIKGNTVWKQNVTGDSISIPANKFTPGNYLLQMYHAGSHSTLKLVKQ